MKKKVGVIFWLVIVMVFVPVILASFSNAARNRDRERVAELKPQSVTAVQAGRTELIFDVSEMDTDNNEILFFSKHQQVAAYSDDKQFYENSYEGGKWGHTPGRNWNWIRVPYQTEELKVVLTEVYEGTTQYLPAFYQGSVLVMYRNIFMGSLPALMVSLLTLIYGIMIAIYWPWATSKFEMGDGVLYIGLFSIIMGAFLLNETDSVVMMSTQHTVAAVVTYMTIMAASPVCILFVKEMVGLRENVIWKLLCFASAAELILCPVLQVMGVADLRETFFVTEIIVALTGVYLFLTVLLKMIKRESAPMMPEIFASMLTIMLSLIIDKIRVFTNPAITDEVSTTRVGIYVALCIFTFGCANYYFGLMKKGLMSDVYEKLAVKDKLTGLHNRNGYILDLDRVESGEDMMVVTFDLNDLKKCNDALGHLQGDRYIISAAEYIEETFADYGRSYRIGGDEFCVLINEASKCPIEDLLHVLENKEVQFRKDNPEIPMYISYGYAVYDKKQDADLEKTRVRADVLMYENKRKAKMC